eukprot:tig00021318_g20186.t1
MRVTAANVVVSTPLVPSQTFTVSAGTITPNDYIQYQYPLTGGWYAWLTVTDKDDTISTNRFDRFSLQTSLDGTTFVDMTDQSQVLAPPTALPSSFTSGRANITRCAGAPDTTVYWRVLCKTSNLAADCDFTGILNIKACNARIASVTLSNGPSYGSNRITIVGDDLLRNASDLAGGADTTVVGRAYGAAAVVSVSADRSAVVLRVPNGEQRGLGEVALRSATHGPSRISAAYTINEPIFMGAILPASHGPAEGSTITVTGTGFIAGDATASVTIGGLAVANLTLRADAAVLRTPSLAGTDLALATPYDLVYTSERSGSWTLTGAWIWKAPEAAFFQHWKLKCLCTKSGNR